MIWHRIQKIRYVMGYSLLSQLLGKKFITRHILRVWCTIIQLMEWLFIRGYLINGYRIVIQSNIAKVKGQSDKHVQKRHKKDHIGRMVRKKRDIEWPSVVEIISILRWPNINKKEFILFIRISIHFDLSQNFLLFHSLVFYLFTIQLRLIEKK